MGGIQASFIGRLTADAEFVVLPGGGPFLRFTVQVEGERPNAAQAAKVGYLKMDGADLVNRLLQGAVVYVAGALSLKDGELRVIAEDLDVRAVIGEPPEPRQREPTPGQQRSASTAQRLERNREHAYGQIQASSDRHQWQPTTSARR
jgi:hypothetical protein